MICRENIPIKSGSFKFRSTSRKPSELSNQTEFLNSRNSFDVFAGRSSLQQSKMAEYSDEISLIRLETFQNFKKLRRQMDKSYIQLNKEGSVQRYGASIFVRP